HGEEDEVRLQLELRAGNGLHLFIHTHTFDGGDMAVLADDAACHHGEVTRGTFCLAGGGPHLERPVRPGEELVLALRRCGHDFKSEEHTSELQSRENLVCRLLLEKKKKRGGSQAAIGQYCRMAR